MKTLPELILEAAQFLPSHSSLQLHLPYSLMLLYTFNSWAPNGSQHPGDLATAAIAIKPGACPFSGAVIHLLDFRDHAALYQT